MEQYVIPRNIMVKETIAYGLNGKQMLYIAVGLGGSAILWTAGIPFFGFIEKVVGSLFCMAGGLALSVAKAYGQELDSYVFNSIKYPLRTKEFEGGKTDDKTKAPVCHIRYSL